MKKRLYTNDLILNAFIILICILIPFVLSFAHNEGKTCVISYDGIVEKRINLEEDAAYHTHGVNIIVKDGEAFVSESSCPDGLCIKMKSAKNVGDSIICVPNKVSVRIEGNKSGEADVVAG